MWHLDVELLDDPVRVGMHTGLEISNVYVSSSDLVRVLKGVDGISNIESRPRFASRKDVRARFRYHDQDWSVIEPFGDNSRYWIVANDGTPEEGTVAVLEQVFLKFQPGPFRRLWRGLLTLRFLRPARGITRR